MFTSAFALALFAAVSIATPINQQSAFSLDESDALSVPEFASRPELFQLHKDLIQVSSLSRHEENATAFLSKYLSNQGLNVELLDSPAGGKNVYAYFGEDKNASVLLTSHIDTVPPYFNYSLERDAENRLRIHGRGSTDAKASVASQIIAAKELVAEKKVSSEDISFLYVVGEEIGGLGMVPADKQLIKEHVGWDTVIFGEPTGNRLAVGHKGIYYFQIRVYGRSCHSGYPELGVDANKALIGIMNDLLTTQFPESKLLGKATVNIGEIDASNAANVLSPYAACTVLIRAASTTDKIAAVVDQIISKHEKDAIRIETETTQRADPTYVDYDAPGFNHTSLSCSTDVPNMLNRGFKRYLYGPGLITIAHSANEYILPDMLEQGVDDYKRLVLHALGRN